MNSTGVSGVKHVGIVSLVEETDRPSVAYVEHLARVMIASVRRPGMYDPAVYNIKECLPRLPFSDHAPGHCLQDALERVVTSLRPRYACLYIWVWRKQTSKPWVPSQRLVGILRENRCFLSFISAQPLSASDMTLFSACLFERAVAVGRWPIVPVMYGALAGFDLKRTHKRERELQAAAEREPEPEPKPGPVPQPEPQPEREPEPEPEPDFEFAFETGFDYEFVEAETELEYDGM